MIQILKKIERELPKLKLAPGEREEANELVASLRKALRDLPGAGARAIGGALAAILNERWKRTRQAPLRFDGARARLRDRTSRPTYPI